MSWSASKPRLRELTITVQNTPVVILETSDNPTGRITVNAEGDFDSGNLEVGYLSDGAFTVYTDAVTTVDGGYELACGSSKDVLVQATGASPVINVAVQSVS